MELHPGLNVFLGANAQGKTSVLEAIGLLARGRSFRTDDSASLVRRGRPGLRVGARVLSRERETALEVEIGAEGRVYRVDGKDVRPSDYRGRLEAIVYSTERLRVVRGSMRERREYVDRGGSALWPAYAQAAREFERVHRQRNAALERRSSDLPAWDERFAVQGARLRVRRADYVARLAAELPKVFRPRGEVYGIELPAETRGAEAEQRSRLEEALDKGRGQEARAGRCLFGPHRDPVALTIDGREASGEASAGQARSLLLALSLAALAVFRQERGRSAVALLDDLDSELDEERALALCAEVAAAGQALVTTAHPGWAERVRHLGRLHHVSAGEVRCAS